MKINEISKITGINSETIRKYRDMGLLNPKRSEENGYYDYSAEDFHNLLYIRKLRESDVSLERIAYTYNHADISDICSEFQKDMDKLESQIEMLRKRQDILRVTMDHFEFYNSERDSVVTIDCMGKYDCYFDSLPASPAMQEWVKMPGLFTQVIGIEKKYLSSPVPEVVPVRAGIGSYADILKSYNMEIPAEAVYFPAGRYATAYVSLTALDHIDGSQLRALVNYLEENNLTPLSDTTAFLFRVDKAGPKPAFIFRLRVRIG